MVHNERQKAQTKGTSRYANGGDECGGGGDVDVLHVEVLADLGAEGDDAREDGCAGAQPLRGAGADGVYGDGGDDAVLPFQPRLFPDADVGAGLVALLRLVKSLLLPGLPRVGDDGGDESGAGARADAGVNASAHGGDSADAARKTDDPGPYHRGSDVHLWHCFVSVGSYLLL